MYIFERKQQNTHETNHYYVSNINIFYIGPFWAHTTQNLADHLQETKAHYCIIQQNTLTNLVIIVLTLNLLASNLASRVMWITISGGITLIGRYYWSLHYRSPACVPSLCDCFFYLGFYRHKLTSGYEIVTEFDNLLLFCVFYRHLIINWKTVEHFHFIQRYTWNSSKCHVV